MVTSVIFVTMKEKAIPAGQFKAKCLALLDEVESKGKSIVVTKRGRPVARVVPLGRGGRGSLRGTLIYEEDALSPIDVEWDATK